MAKYGTASGVLKYATRLDYKAMGFASGADYTNFLDGMLDAAYDRINAILGHVLAVGDTYYEGVREVAERRVANILPLVSQMNTSPVIRVNDFTVKIVNMADLWKDMEKDLAPFMDQTAVPGGGGAGSSGFDMCISGGRKSWQ